MKTRLQHITNKLIRIAFKSYIFVAVLVSMLCGTIFASGGFNTLAHAASSQGSVGTQLIASSVAKQENTQNTLQSSNAAPTPFLHRPFYGSQTIGSRTTSFFDHDEPWYASDGIFVRYDGARWTTNDSILSCTGGVNCYDGHDGYDLNLHFEPVLSAAAGTVIRAGWYNPLNHWSAFGLWVAIDHGNGYATVYGHLSALTVAIGDQVGTQWQIGTSGTTGASTGPHLHFGTYYLPNWNATDPFGWTGNYTDPNVVPDNYLWVSDPGTSNSIPDLSNNGNAIYPGATLVDDGGAGWSSTGHWNIATSSTDIQGDLHWTATTSGNATATATWQPHITADGYYEVGVFVDDNNATSGWAPYTIYSADPAHAGAVVRHLVYVDELHIGSFQGPYGSVNTGPQWVGLGTYYFRASMSPRVVLSNATGENGAQVAADGMEFVPVSTHSTQPTPVYRFAMPQHNTPNAMLPGSTTSVKVTLQNTSNFLWKANGSQPVQLIYRWLNAQNHIVATGNPTALQQDVAVNADVALTVQVQTPTQPGAYTLQWDMLLGTETFSHQGAQVINNSIEVTRYAENFAKPVQPTLLPPDSTIHVNVTVQNQGAFTWPASGNAQVTLGYRWLDSSGHTVSSQVADTSSVGRLTADVPPGGSTSVLLAVHTPVLAGNDQLVYDLQQQGTWFSSQGATPLAVPMTITPTLPNVYYFAEGYTGTGTTEYLSLVNPSATQATITITYLFSNSAPLTRVYQVAAQAQRVLNINAEVGANHAVSMIVQGNAPFVAERSMYTQKGAFVGASDSIGSTALSTTWYFAEGNTTSGWNTLLAVMNPSTQPATVKVTYLLTARSHAGAALKTSTYVIPASSRGTIVLNNNMPNAQFGLAITASTAVVIERPETLVQGNLRGGSSVVGATAPQTAWYFGAGNTSPGFNERLVLANPFPGWTDAQISYLTTDGSVITQSVGVPGQSRIEVNVNTALQSKYQATHATLITAISPIVAERQDFFITTINGNTIAGSTTVMGTTSAHASWYLAQGDTTNGHMESLALANPNNQPTQVQVVYYLSSGAPLIKSDTLATNARMTIDLTDDVGANATLGIAIYATLPIVVEQSMFFNINGASGGYASMALGVS